MTRLFENPPPEIPRSSHPTHNLRLVNSDDAPPFRCGGCKEPGYGPRYTYDDGGRAGHQSFDLHTCCALAEQEPTIKHPLFGDLNFTFLTEPPPPVKDTVCDACGEDAHGFVYHCFEKDLDLHPCCARLPQQILQQEDDSRVFELSRDASRRCIKCGKNGRRRNFWAYRSYFDDGECMDIHVACMKEMARLSWNAPYENRVGGGQIVRVIGTSTDRMLRSFPGNKRRSGFDQFISIVGIVARIIIGVIFGNPTPCT